MSRERRGEENGNKDKAELCSKRGIDKNVAGNRRAMRRSNSWVGSNVEVIKQSAKRMSESDGSQPPVTLICQKHGPNQRLVIVNASIKMTDTGYSREGSGSRWWLMLVTREFS